MCVCMYVCINVCQYVCVCMFLWYLGMQVCTYDTDFYMYMCVRIYVCACTYICTHTLTPAVYRVIKGLLDRIILNCVCVCVC